MEKETNLHNRFNSNLFSAELILKPNICRERNLCTNIDIDVEELNNAFHAVSTTDIIFNVSTVIDGTCKTVSPIRTILTCINEDICFDIVLSFHDVENTVIGIYTYHDVKLVGSDFFEREFSYEDPGDLIQLFKSEDQDKRVRVYFTYSKRTWCDTSNKNSVNINSL